MVGRRLLRPTLFSTANSLAAARFTQRQGERCSDPKSWYRYGKLARYLVPQRELQQFFSDRN